MQPDESTAARPRKPEPCVDCGTELLHASPDGRCGFCTEDPHMTGEAEAAA